MTRYAHTIFVIERTLPGTPDNAFRFFSDPALKRRWTECHPDWQPLEVRMDFRTGGEEVSCLRAQDGRAHEFRARYLDIAPERHIIYAFTMRTDGALVSSSQATIEFTPTSTGTTMLYTEQAVFLHEADIAPRRSGTGEGFDRLILEIEKDAATLQ